MGATRTAAALTLGAIIAFTKGAPGQEAVWRVTLAEALAAFGDNSLALRIARAEYSAATAAAHQYRAYSNPGFSLVREDIGRAGDRYWETTVGLVQQVEWPARTAARRRVADHAKEGAAARFRADSARLAFDVRKAYVQVWLAEEEERAAQRAAEVIRAAVQVGEHRLKAGDISLYKARILRIERVQSEQDEGDAMLRARAARRQLAVLIAPESATREAGPSGGLDGLPPAITRRAALEALSDRPDLRAAAKDLDAARARSKVVRTEWLPDPAVSLGYKDQADGFSGGALGLILPLPVLDRGTGARRAAAERESVAAYRLGLLQRSAETDLLAASDRCAAARDRLAALGDSVLAEADAFLETALAARAEGELALLELVDAVRVFRAGRSSALSLRSEAWIAYYDLLRAMGRAPGEEQ